MLRPRRLACGFLCLTLTACASGQDHYENSEMGRLTGRPKRVLSDAELRGNCPGLTITLKSRIDRLRELEKKVKQEQQGPRSTLMAMWEERPANADLVMERERIAELNAALGAKGCKTLDVEEELRRAPAPAIAAKQK